MTGLAGCTGQNGIRIGCESFLVGSNPLLLKQEIDQVISFPGHWNVIFLQKLLNIRVMGDRFLLYFRHDQLRIAGILLTTLAAMSVTAQTNTGDRPVPNWPPYDGLFPLPAEY